MFDKDAIKEIAQAQSIDEAGKAVGFALSSDTETSTRGAVALPVEYNITDLESYMPTRRRLRGSMHTSVVADFATYTELNSEKGAAVFIEPERMVATAVLNLGTTDAPGHADNLATLELKRTAAYIGLRRVSTGQGLKQTDVAEFLEDWTDIIKCQKDGELVSNAKAIAAVRNITIEAMRKMQSEEQQLSASRSAFESVQAKSEDPIPTQIHFTCKPYSELAERTFVLRLGILTSNDKPSITLRVIKIEEHEEQMAKELAEVVSEAITGDEISVIIGKYSIKG